MNHPGGWARALRLCLDNPPGIHDAGAGKCFSGFSIFPPFKCSRVDADKFPDACVAATQADQVALSGRWGFLHGA